MKRIQESRLEIQLLDAAHRKDGSAIISLLSNQKPPKYTNLNELGDNLLTFMVRYDIDLDLSNNILKHQLDNITYANKVLCRRLCILRDQNTTLFGIPNLHDLGYAIAVHAKNVILNSLQLDNLDFPRLAIHAIKMHRYKMAKMIILTKNLVVQECGCGFFNCKTNGMARQIYWIRTIVNIIEFGSAIIERFGVYLSAEILQYY